MSEVMSSCNGELPPASKEGAEDLSGEAERKEIDSFLRHIDDDKKPIIGGKDVVVISDGSSPFKVTKITLWRTSGEIRNGKNGKTKTIYTIYDNENKDIEIKIASGESLEDVLREYSIWKKNN